VLALGGAPRRRLAVAVQAWLAARRAGADVELVVVGTERPLTQTEGLRWIGVVDDSELAALLSRAEAFLYPTAYEGFGLPALEAAACATPTVCAPVGALPEVLGDAAEWSAGTDPEAVAEALLRICLHPERRAELGSRARRRALSGTSWSTAAHQTLAAYRLAGGVR
jgi:glycosyltransferase involved in cell wall biosynthesis